MAVAGSEGRGVARGQDLGSGLLRSFLFFLCPLRNREMALKASMLMQTGNTLNYRSPQLVLCNKKKNKRFSYYSFTLFVLDVPL